MLDLDVPPPAGPDADLLARTARWTNGPDHASRRSAARALIADVSVPMAAAAAGRAASAWLRAQPHDRIDVLPLLRTVPLTVLSVLIGDAGIAATGVLIQSRDATAALAAARLTGSPESPVRHTSRLSGGVVVVVPLTAETSFGAGAHRCPGQELALALAEAMVAAIREHWHPVAAPVVHDPALPNLRLPLEVVVERR